MEVHNEEEDDGDVSSITVFEEIFDLNLMAFKKGRETQVWNRQAIYRPRCIKTS